MTVSTTYFREHLAEIITRVADYGEEVVLVFGKGKKSKKVNLSALKTATPTKKAPRHANLIKFLESDFYKNHKSSPELQNAKDFKEIMDKYYDINDFVV